MEENFDLITPLILEAPDQAGIYIFKDKDENYIYIGSAVNLKKRVYWHLMMRKNQLKAAAILGASTKLEFILIEDIKVAREKEKTLIAEHNPRFNYVNNGWFPDRNVPQQFFSLNVPMDIYERVKLCAYRRNITLKTWILRAIEKGLLEEVRDQR